MMIIKYRVADGEILCVGSFRNVQINDGEAVLIYTGNRVIDRVDFFKVMNGDLVEKSQDDRYKALFRELRRNEYPSLGEGLDALVHKENGNLAPWSDYVSKCNAVKAKYPKPN